MAIKLKVNETKASLKVNTDGAVRFTAESGIPIYPEDYTGTYEVTPSNTEQTLETNGLMMTDNVTVDAVPLAGRVSAYAYANIEDDWTIDDGWVSFSYEAEREGYLTAERSGLVEVNEFNEIENSLLTLEIRGAVQLPTEDGRTITPTDEEQLAIEQGTYALDDIVVAPIPNNYGLITWNGSILTVS